MVEPHERPRSMPEWLVVIALVALLVVVAWTQFGPLFDQPTDGGTRPAPTVPAAGEDGDEELNP